MGEAGVSHSSLGEGRPPAQRSPVGSYQVGSSIMLPALVQWPLSSRGGLLGSVAPRCVAVSQATFSRAGLWQALALLVPVELHAGWWVMQLLPWEVLRGFWSDRIARLVRAGYREPGCKSRGAVSSDKLTRRHRSRSSPWL